MALPGKIRDLPEDYRKAGFTIVKGGKGDHRKLRHDKNYRRIYRWRESR